MPAYGAPQMSASIDVSVSSSTLSMSTASLPVAAVRSPATVSVLPVVVE